MAKFSFKDLKGLRRKEILGETAAKIVTFYAFLTRT